VRVATVEFHKLGASISKRSADACSAGESGEDDTIVEHGFSAVEWVRQTYFIKVIMQVKQIDKVMGVKKPARGGLF
jgi:hypothetical protein